MNNDESNTYIHLYIYSTATFTAISGSWNTYFGEKKNWVHMKGAKSAITRKLSSSHLYDVKQSRKFSMIYENADESTSNQLFKTDWLIISDAFCGSVHDKGISYKYFSSVLLNIPRYFSQHCPRLVKICKATLFWMWK